jgi:hypothetical protein
MVTDLPPSASLQPETGMTRIWLAGESVDRIA